MNSVTSKCLSIIALGSISAAALLLGLILLGAGAGHSSGTARPASIVPTGLISLCLDNARREQERCENSCPDTSTVEFSPGFCGLSAECECN